MQQNLSYYILVLILGLKEGNSQIQVKIINPILIFKMFNSVRRGAGLYILGHCQYAQ